MGELSVVWKYRRKKDVPVICCTISRNATRARHSMLQSSLCTNVYNRIHPAAKISVSITAVRKLSEIRALS